MLRCLFALIVSLPWLGPVPGGASSQPSSTPTTRYQMSANTSMQYGCFPPCLCPNYGSGPLDGTFLLTPTEFDGLYQHYDVSAVDWTFTLWDYAQNAARNVHVAGGGSYQQGGEFARMQRMILDLSLDGAKPQHFDSDLVPAGPQFPEIDVSVWLHGGYCFDSLFEVRASPTGVVAVEQVRAPAGLRGARPNPFQASVEIEFALAQPGWARLGMFDLTGREVRVLADEPLTAGRHRRTWDGRSGSGRPCEPGVYFARLRANGREHRQAVVRIW